MEKNFLNLVRTWHEKQGLEIHANREVKIKNIKNNGSKTQ